MASEKTRAGPVIRGTGPRKAPAKIGDSSKPPGARSSGRAHSRSSPSKPSNPSAGVPQGTRPPIDRTPLTPRASLDCPVTLVGVSKSTF